MTITASSTRFGTMAVKLGYIDRDQLVEALAQQIDDDLDERPHRPLGMILIEKGWMTLPQIEDVLDKVGEYLCAQ